MTKLFLALAFAACSSKPALDAHPIAIADAMVDATIVDANAIATTPDAAPPAAEATLGKRTYAKTTPRGALQSDLLSEPCNPGATCETHVTLPVGMRLIGKVVLDNGKPGTASPFVLSSATERPLDSGETDLTVIGINRGATSARLRGLFQYGANSQKKRSP